MLKRLTDTLTIERTTLIVLFLLLFAMATRVQVDADMWWHLRTGQWMVETGEIVRVDQFSHTFLGEPRTHYEWLSQIILYGVWSLAGDIGLALFTTVLAVGGLAVLYRALEGNTYLRAFALVLCAATAAVFWSARPQMFTFFFSAVIVYIVYLYKRKEIDRLWLLPLVFLAWAQLHVGWSIGFIILGATIVGEILNNLTRDYLPRIQADHIVTWARGPRLVIFTLISGAVLLLNPYGFDLLLVPFQTVSIGALSQFIQEWNPPNFARPEVWPFLALLVGTVAAIVIDWRKLDWTEVLLVGGSGFLAVSASRNIAFFAVVATPVLAYHVNGWLTARGWTLSTVKKPTPTMIRLNLVLILVVALGVVANVLAVADPETVAEGKASVMPVDAVAYLNDNQPDGPLFNSYNWGGYIMFHSDYPVYIDGRTDLYRDFVLDFAEVWSGAEGWQDALEGINLVLIETEVGLSRRLIDSDDWDVAYRDDLATVFVRRE